MEPTMMNFSQALDALKAGQKIARTGWNGKDMFAFLVDGSKFKVNRAPLNVIFLEGTEVTYRPHLDLKAVDGTIGVWTPSTTDILSEDWYIVGAPVDTKEQEEKDTAEEKKS